MERLCGIESLVEVLSTPDAGCVRCTARSLQQLGRQPNTGRVQCHSVHCQAQLLRPLLEGGLVWWERLVTLDLAKTLELGTADRAGGGLRGGLCRSLAEENANWIDSDDLTAMLPPIFQQLKALRRMSIAITFEDTQNHGKLSAPNCLQEVGSIKTLRELYVATDHCCLEVALLGALAQLGSLQSLWLHLGSLQYNEAVSAAMVARLPTTSLEVLSIWGTARLLRDVLTALGPKGSRRMPKLRELDLSMNREGPGGRITDSRHGPGEVPSDHVWAVLQSGAPGLEKFCLCGALAWYPPIAEAWFSQLLDIMKRGYGQQLKLLDLRLNKIRADVAERLQEKLWHHRKDFQLLWDGGETTRVRVVASRDLQSSSARQPEKKGGCKSCISASPHHVFSSCHKRS